MRALSESAVGLGRAIFSLARGNTIRLTESVDFCFARLLR